MSAVGAQVHLVTESTQFVIISRL